MAEYVAFLRGINVGGHNKLKMGDLRQAFAAWGFENVKTVLASGNVLFQSSVTDAGSLAATIKDKIQESFSLDVNIIVRNLKAVQDLVDSRPFDGITVTPETRLYVTFLAEKLNSDLNIPCESPDGDFKILRTSEGEVCSVLTLTSESRTTEAMDILEKEFGKNVTTRNWNTITRIAGM